MAQIRYVRVVSATPQNDESPMEVRPGYQPPVSHLLDLDDPGEGVDHDYAAMGIEPKHVSELIRLVTDPTLNFVSDGRDEPSGPMHAWRALCQLGASEAITPIMEWFEAHGRSDEDWFWDELLWSLMDIGDSSAAPLAAWLKKEPPTRWGSQVAATGLGEVGKWSPEVLPACTDALVDSLKRFADHTPQFNARLVEALTELRAKKAVSLIKKAIKAGAVDEDITGGWESISERLHSIPDIDDPGFGPLDFGQRGIEAAKNVTGTAHETPKRKSSKGRGRPKQHDLTALFGECSPKVSALMELGLPPLYDELDYQTQFGFAEADIPELIRLGTHWPLLSADSDVAAIWGPGHAWKALAQMGNATVVKPLMQVFEYPVASVNEDLVEIFHAQIEKIGTAALEPLAECLKQEPKGGPVSEEAAMIIAFLGDVIPDLRSPCVALLVATLGRFAEHPPEFNDRLVIALVMMRAEEARPVVKAARDGGGLTNPNVAKMFDVDFAALAGGDPSALLEIGAAEGWGGSYIPPQPFIASAEPGRNDPCPCGSGKKYKKCCGK